MRHAFACSTDTVHAGQPRYSLCVRNNESNCENLQLGINEAHVLGRELYVAVNIALCSARLKTFICDLRPVTETGPDALIMSDPGLIMLVREHFPEMPIHLSVQANAVNWVTAKFWQQTGPIRVILSRELSLGEIEEIRRQVPEMEIEIPVHDALCMAYFDRYLLFEYINKYDPDQGTYTSACRWECNATGGKEDDVDNIVHKYEPIPMQIVEPTLDIGAPTDKAFMIEEAKRPGEYMTASKDEHGTYIMNSKDLRIIAHVKRLAQMGVHSLKVEGYTKSFYYRACTAQVYHKIIDDAAAGKPFDISLLEALEGLAHHGHTEGFLRRHTHDDHQNYEYGYFLSERRQFAGEFTGGCNDPLTAVAVKSEFSVGDSPELVIPQGNVNFTLEHMENGKGETMPMTPGDGYTIWLPVPDDLSLQYMLLIRSFTGQTIRNSRGNQLTCAIFSRSKDIRIGSHTVSIETGIIHLAEEHNP